MAGIVVASETRILVTTYALAGSGVSLSWRIQPSFFSCEIRCALPFSAPLKAPNVAIAIM